MKFWDDMQKGVASNDKIIMIGNPDNGTPEYTTKSELFKEINEATETAQESLGIITNAQFIFAFVTSDGYVVYGHRWDGSMYAPKGMPDEVRNALFEKLGINDLVDKIDDSNKPITASAIHEVISPMEGQYLQALVDGDKRLLEWIANDGLRYFPKQVLIDKFSSKQYPFFFQFEDGKIPLAINTKGEVVGDFPAIIREGKRIDGLRVDVDNLIKGVGLIRKIPVFGNSLTAGGAGGFISYVPRLQQRLGNAYQFINCGVGGESAATIAARQGGVPAFITESFVLPADASIVEISSQANYRLKNKFGKIVTPLLQGSGNSVNPCYINGIECTMTYNYDSKKWFLKRNIITDKETTIQPDTPIYFNAAKECSNIHAAIFFFGANNGIVNGVPVGHDDDEQLVQYYKDVVAFARTHNYLIIGLPNRNNETGANLEKLMSDTFGLRYFNWRKYAITYGLIDAEITPTQADITAMNNGEIPPSLLTDSIHYNDAGYEVLTTQIENKLTELGII